MTTAQPIATHRQAILISAETSKSSRRRLWTGRVLTDFRARFSSSTPA
jgi:hypothetical protein